MAYQEPRSRPAQPSMLSTVVSGLLTPLGVLVLFSFGAQIVFAPFVLAIEWILARVALRPVRIIWSVLAGALAGEYVYLLFDLRVEQVDGLPAVLLGLVTAALVIPVYLWTTRPSK
jgi:hypothetical protein